jgi:hypothetical protein
MKVFLSSTKADLGPHREAVYESLKDDHEVVRMEDWGSVGAPPLEWCLAQVEACEALVVLLGYRYGSRDPETGISYTEAEYEHARTHSIPVLAYVRHRFDQYVPRTAQSDADRQRLRDLRTQIERAQVVRRPYFKTPVTLAPRVRRDIDQFAATGTLKPTFGSKRGGIRDEATYAIERSRRSKARLVPFPIVLVNTAALDLEKYPTSAGGRLARKVLDVYRELDAKDVQVTIFNDLPIDDLRLGAVLEQRIGLVAHNARAVLCFVKEQGDAAKVELFRDVESILEVFHPSTVSLPSTIDPKSTHPYSDEELDSCDVGSSALRYALEERDYALLTAFRERNA